MTQEIRVTNYPEVLTDRASHYCPGCHHGTAHRLVAEAITDLGLVDKTILVGSIGCSVFITTTSPLMPSNRPMAALRRWPRA